MNHAPSPAAGGATDDTAYMEKWKQLQKYIEPLKRMINRIVKDEGLLSESLLGFLCSIY